MSRRLIYPKVSHQAWFRPTRILQKVRGIAQIEFEASDVVRHPLVARIVEAYARENAKKKS